MTPQRFQQIETLFEAALDRDPQERIAWLAQTCADDEELFRVVEKMLADDAAAGQFIEQPPALVTEVLLDALTESDPLIGQRLGVYRLARELGRGGMGAVYLAERDDHEFEQRVAIKLIKRGMDSDEIVQRFRQERQILAQLNHPHIARLLDGGTTPDGRPYFVMDYIEGEPLYAWCDSQQLGLRERIALFLQICAAVDYAHRQRVLHRDLKPSNLLVSREDGAVRLLDFGIARLLVVDREGDTLTLTGERLLTPHYASPEQVRGLPLTFASDVYSLGLVLYELLTGRRPYALSGQAWHEISRVICENTPVPPSHVVWSNSGALKVNIEDATIEEISNARKHTPASLGATLAGALDNVVMKALRKDPQERYFTAAELSDDLARWLRGDEVRANDPLATARLTPKKNTGELDEPALQRLAVLPFKLLSAPTENYADEEFLRVGLADSLIARLSRLDRITVRPTSSVLRFQSATDPIAAGRELDVHLVLDGLIRRAATRMRVSVQLLDVKTGTTRWAGQFDESVTDVLTLEDVISTRVAEALLPQLTGDERRQIAQGGTSNAEAHEAYLRSRHYWNQFTPESLPKAMIALEQAIALDPHYALAHVGLADFYVWASIYGLIPSKAALAQAEAAARRALELDDQLAAAYATLSLVISNRFDWAEAEKLALHAIRLNPQYIHAHEWRGAQLVGTGKTEAGLEEIRLMERLDPLSTRTKTLAAWTFYQAHRFDEALERGRQIVELDKHYPQGYLQIGVNLLALGRAAEAVEHFEMVDQMMSGSALPKFQLCHGYVALGRTAEARAVLLDIQKLAEVNYVKPYFLAMAHVALDEHDQAFSYFQQSVDEYEPWMIWFGTDPMLARLRDDDRYRDLLQRMNMPAAATFKR